MLTLPIDIVAIFSAFQSLFSRPLFRHIQILLIGAILTPGSRTVTNALRAMGLQHEKQFQKYHRVLNRAKWSSRHAAKILLSLLIRFFAPTGEVVIGIDETLERRRGEKIAARGIYRDATRSSKSFFVKSSGLRWISMMLLAPISWAQRIWALPFLTILAPSERYDTERHHRHKTVAQWAGQMILQVRRWLPDRPLIIVGDGSYSVLTLLERCLRFPHPVTMVTRLRLDAALYKLAPRREASQIGRPRKKGCRLPTLEKVLGDESTVWVKVTVPCWYGQKSKNIEIVTDTVIWYHSGMTPVPIRYVLIKDPNHGFASQALLCTDLCTTPLQIVSWFVQRWQLETTFQEVRTHLGVETQRQWNDLAILRTTPALFGLFSMVTLLANRQANNHKLFIRQASWYVKERPTFSDALASVRRELWGYSLFCTSPFTTDVQKLQQSLMQRFEHSLCYAT